MRPEDFTVGADRYGNPHIDCPVGGCGVEITDWDVDDWDAQHKLPDLGSLLDAARDHLTTHHSGASE